MWPSSTNCPHPSDPTADVYGMASPLTPSRFGRRAFLGIVCVATAMIALSWFDDLHPVLRATLPARAAAVAGIGAAVHLGIVRQSAAERLLFWLGLGMAVARVWFLGDVSVERAALVVRVDKVDSEGRHHIVHPVRGKYLPERLGALLHKGHHRPRELVDAFL